MARSFQSNLEIYAEVITEAGLNLQPGQELFVQATVEAVPLVREIASAAYRRGSPLVETVYSDPVVELSRYTYGPEGSFQRTEEQLDIAGKAAKAGKAILSLTSPAPGLMDHVEPDRKSTYERAYGNRRKDLRAVAGADGTNWCVASVPSQVWANYVFPNAAHDQRLPKLWQEMFRVCRVLESNPLVSWRQHNDHLRRQAEGLNDSNFAALNFLSARTKLTVELAKDHVWQGGASTTTDGREILFSPNIPTEEVFTLPDRLGVEGHVVGTRPVVHNGTTIDGYSFRFVNGRVVDYSARAGETALRSILETDDGASHLGEIALVSMDSPIATSRIKSFGSTLLDENARSHMALGSGYRTTLRNGSELSDSEFIAKGGNVSSVHVDVMIGSPNMDVYGITQNGGEVPIIRHGVMIPTLRRK